jgi:uncharacterized protein YjbI with pentapeptide repeats
LYLADLRGSDLRRSDLKGADLKEASLLPYDERDPERWSLHNLKKEINLSELSKEKRAPRRLKWARALNIGLPWHTFRKVRWRGVRPTIAKLTVTNLKGANLAGASLQKTWLGAADLTNAVLTNAVLTNAVGVTSEELAQQAYSLEGATMPNGQKKKSGSRVAERMRRTAFSNSG